MDIRELEDFRLQDAVKFHSKLNSKLWDNNKLRPEVKDQLLKIANDFILELGIAIPKIQDITVSGSNAAYSYTPHSDLDLHILVDFNQLPNNEVYQELFTSKKTLYNDSHDITVNGVPVELYVQDSNQPVVSLGEYSIVNDDWIKIPKKGKANFDQTATKAKYEKLGKLIELALKSKDIKKVEKVLDVIKRYRKAGLSSTGEFGPENLAFKALRSQGYIKKLYDFKNNLHSKDLSLEDWHPNDKPPGPEFPPTMPMGTIRVDVSDVYDWYKLGQHISDMKGLGKHDFGKGPPSTILSFGDEDLEHQYIDALNKTGLDVTDIDPKGHEPKKGIKTDPTYNVNEILDKESAAKVYWSQDNYMTGGKVNQNFTLHTAAALDKNKNILKYNFYDFPKYSLTAVEFSRAVGPWGDSFGIDNAGDQYTVFATLIKTFEEYLSNDKPKYIMFGAKEPSRAKLYQAFVNRFANKFGYKQISPDNIPKPVSSMILNSGDTPFLLARTDLVKESVKFIEGTNCKNCVWWKKDSEKPVGKDELNKYGGLKPPNKEYIAMSKRVDLVTLPGKDTVKEKGFCYHKDINDWVTERMCCAKWDGKGVLRDYKGESPLMEESAPQVDENIEKVDGGWLHTGVGHRFDWATNSYPVYPLPRYRTYVNQARYVHGSYNDIIQYMHFLLNNYLTKNIEISGQEIADTLAKIGNKSSEQELETFNKKHDKSWKSWDEFFDAYKKYEEEKFQNAMMRIGSKIGEASGYIPSEKEKNDPRFKTSLTVDVKPNSIKKNAKAFGWDISRTGIPPLLRK